MKKLGSVFLVQHMRDEIAETSKVIGIYSSIEKARSGIDRLMSKPGFKDNPKGFYIDEYTIDEDNWTSGFGI